MSTINSIKRTEVIRKGIDIVEKNFGYLVLLGVLIYQTHAASERGSKRAQALSALYYADQVEKSIVLAESAQRGYLVTGDTDLRTDFIRSQAAYNVWLIRLRASFNRDARDTQKIEHVDELAKEKFAGMQKTVDLYDSGKAQSAKQIVESHEGQRYMRDIRDELADLRAAKEIDALSTMQIVATLTT